MQWVIPHSVQICARLFKDRRDALLGDAPEHALRRTDAAESMPLLRDRFRASRTPCVRALRKRPLELYPIWLRDARVEYHLAYKIAVLVRARIFPMLVMDVALLVKVSVALSPIGRFCQ